MVQLLGNRAQTSLDLCDYRSCILDCDAALGLLALPGKASIVTAATRSKIHYRKCKALFTVHRLSDCLQSCLAAMDDLKQDPSQMEVRQTLLLQLTHGGSLSDFI